MGHAYVFVLSPPFSGSTPLYRMLGTSPSASTLFGHGNWAGEGQFLESVAPLMRPNPTGDPRVGGFWDPAVALPWDAIKREWDRHWDTSKRFLVEKSPPNVCRAHQLAEFFSGFGEVYFVALIRSPYAVKQEAARWVEQAEHQRRNLSTLPNVLLLRYEALCEDQTGAARRIEAFVPGLGPLDPEMRSMAGVVGGERGERLENKNELTPSLVEHRNAVLERHEGLLEYFGYRVLRPGTEAWDAVPFLPEVAVETRVPAAPADVFRAWTEVDALLRWWAGAARTEERFVLTVDQPERFDVELTLLEAVPRERVRLACAWSRLDPVVDDTIVEVDLRGDAGATHVTVRELRVPRSNFGGSRAFWTERLAALSRVFA